MSGRPNCARKLVLETPDRAADGAGGFAETWRALGTVWAEIRPRTGHQSADLGRITHRIVLRAARQGAPSRPVAGQRFREGGRLFQIATVTELGGDDRFLICDTTEETAR